MECNMIDTAHRDLPTCPHCGHEHATFCAPDLFPDAVPYDATEGETWEGVQCPACDQFYAVEAHVTVTWSTRPGSAVRAARLVELTEARALRGEEPR